VRDGVRIGLIRIPTFNGSDWTPVFRSEIAYMQANTDGLVVDIMRNPGGDACFAEDLLRDLIPSPFRMVGLEIRATRTWLVSFEQALVLALASGAPQETIAQYQNLLKAVQTAYLTPSGRTAALPVCDPTLDVQPDTDVNGNVLAYTKPIVLLTDEFSASAADLFAAVFQDAGRGVIFGARTMGAGGNVENFSNVTTYSEGQASITESLMVRKAPIPTDEFGPTSYIENVGVRPDIVKDYMTRDNLTNGGWPFIDAFTEAIVMLVKTQR
jgi:C-terminal processing protease CtpA/Prc